jgi:hypothetical protein
MRSKRGMLVSDRAITLLQDQKMLTTIKKGEQYKALACDKSTYYFSVSLSSDDLSLFGKQYIDIENGKTYYFKVGIVAGIEEPTLTLLDAERGRELLNDHKAFESSLQEINLHNEPLTQRDNNASDGIHVTSGTTGNSDSQAIKFNTPAPPKVKNEVAKKPVRTAEEINTLEQLIQPDDHALNRLDYYFFLQRKLIDARDFSVVADNVDSGEMKELADGKFALLTANNQNFFRIYDKNNKLLKSYPVEGHLAPSWTYTIILKDGDLWRQEIDIATGTLSTPKRITQLGIFDRYFNYKNWYGDLVVFHQAYNNQDAYLLNTKTGDVRKLGFQIAMDLYPSSPSGRYFNVSLSNNTQSGVYDFEEEKFLKGSPLVEDNNILTWFNHKVAGKITTRSKNNIYTCYLQIVHMDNPSKVYEVEVGNNSCMGRFFYTSNRIGKAFINNFLLPYKMEIPHETSTQYLMIDAYNIKNIRLMDIPTGKEQIWLDKSQGEIHKSAWISSTEVLYSVKGELLSQGTYILDTKTGEKSKLTPYAADEIWIFRNTGYALVWANNTLYTFHKNELTKHQSDLNKYRANVKVLRAKFE